MSLGVPGKSPLNRFWPHSLPDNIVLAEAFDEYSEHYQGKPFVSWGWRVGGLGSRKWDPLLGESKLTQIVW